MNEDFCLYLYRYKRLQEVFFRNFTIHSKRVLPISEIVLKIRLVDVNKFIY